MRIVRFFKDSVTGQLTLLLILLLIFLLLIVQFGINRTYENSLQSQLVSIETRSVRMQAQNVNTMLSPYLRYLYDKATDYQLVEEMYDLDPDTRLVSRRRVQNDFINTVRDVYYLRGMGVIYEDGTYFFYEKDERFSDFWRDDGEELRSQLYGMAMESQYPVSLFGSDKNYVFVAVPAVSVDYRRAETTVCVVAAYDFSFLDNTMLESDSNSTMNFLVDANGCIIGSADEAHLGVALTDIATNPNLLEVDCPVNTLGWKLYVLVDKQVMLEDLTSVSAVVSYSYIIATLLLAAALVIFFHSLLAPLRRMSEAMVEAGRGNLKVRVPIAGKNELWQTVGGFNEMMDRLDGYYETNMRYYQKLLDVERRKNQAEMAMMESHINAHFLYNTLNVINYQALAAENYQVSTSIKRLSNIMRYAFNSRMKNVRLYQEAAWVEQYLQMQKERLGERMNYDISIADDVADWPFRKMMLQPFVENAVIHGIRGVEDALILVTAQRMADGRLCVKISDNGRGMDEEKARHIRRILDNPAMAQEGGIGIPNVAERIYAFFGSDSEILFKTAPGQGACFILKLPMPNGDELKYGYLEDEEEENEIY